MRTGKTMTLLSGIGVGAGLMYLLDPLAGRRRRARLEQRARHDVREAVDETSKASRDMAHRTRGLIARAAGLLGRRAPIDDVILGERVRARLGRLSAHPGAIEILCTDGAVVLGGYVLRADHKRVVDGVVRVRGVKSVEDRLDVHDEPGAIPSLQGHQGPAGPWWQQDKWPPTVRVLGTGAGAWILVHGLRSGFLGRLLWAPIGTGLLVRGVLNAPWKRIVGLSSGAHGIAIRKTIHLNVPVEKVYAFWRAFDTYPRFMSHVREIRRLDGGGLRWRVEGPGGAEFQWDADITSEKLNEELAWRSRPGSSVDNEGVVRFFRWGEGTQVEIQMAYNPPAGVVGHAIAKLFGKDPKREIDDDLVRFKSLLEAGKATGRECTVTRDEIAAQIHPNS